MNDAKRYLSQAFRIDQHIRAKEEQLDAMRRLTCEATSRLDPDDPNLANILSFEEAIDAELQALLTLKREIADAIRDIPDPLGIAVLEQRYLYSKRWKDIASDMGYSLSHLFRLHGKAINCLESRGE